MNSIIEILLMNMAAVTLLELTGWLISLKKKNVTIADSLWSLGFIIISCITFIQFDGFWVRRIIVTAAVIIWGLRLFIHITKRGLGKPEDPRYTEWRK